MQNQYFILHFLLWITTLAFISFFDFIAKKRIGRNSQGYVNIRLPKFISLAISSVTAIVSIYLLSRGLLNDVMASYLAVPYFASNSYFIVVFFRETKRINS